MLDLKDDNLWDSGKTVDGNEFHSRTLYTNISYLMASFFQFGEHLIKKFHFPADSD